MSSRRSARTTSDRATSRRAPRRRTTSGQGPVGTRRRRTAAAIGITLALGATVSGCAQAVPAEAAVHATDPDCASLVLATPDTLGDGLDRRRTTAQATTAWGDPAIVLRCGVEPPGPTTDRCETVSTPGGPSVDWLVVPDHPEADETSDWTLTTYGRVPAVELHVPATARQERSTSYVDALGPAIAANTEQLRSCL